VRAVTKRVASQVLASRLRGLGDRAVRLAAPAGAPLAHAAGPDPDRVLVVGCGPTTAGPAPTVDEALPGRLARRLVTATGRGTLVEAPAAGHAPLRDVVAHLAARDLSAHDGVVVVLGLDDAAAVWTDTAWTALLGDLVDTVERVGSASTELVVVGLPRPSAVPGLDLPAGGIADRWVDEVGDLTRDALADRELAVVVPAPVPPSGVDPDSDADDAHRLLAEAVVRGLARRLTRHAEEADRGLAPSRAARLAPQPVERLLADPTGARLRDGERPPRLDAIVAHARALFGTQGASFTVLDDRVQWNVGRDGHDEESRPIERSLCRTTITASRPYVASSGEDGEPLLPDSDLHFYAGYPVESPDGTRIGALCVFDSHPRPTDTVDLDLLRDLALAIQREVWATEQDATGAGTLDDELTA